MKKQFASLILGMLAITALQAQTTLPTFHDVDGPVPMGWTLSLQQGNTTYAGGQSGSACRLDQTNDNVEIAFAEDGGEVHYYLKGQTTGAPWEGHFTLQESVDGTNWTDKRVFNDGDINVTSTQF